MLLLFKRELRANRKSLLIWSVVMLCLAGVGLGEYSVVLGPTSSFDVGAMMSLMPHIVLVMFGMGGTNPVSTPEGWYACLYLWCSIVAYLHAAMLGASILSKEESDKTAEFLFTRPVKRSAVVGGKMLAAAVNVFVVVLIGWLTALAVFGPNANSALIGQMHVTMLGMFVVSLVFLFVGLCLSAVATGRGKATQYAAVAIVATYFIAVAIEAVGGLEFLDFLSPFRYFDADRVITQGVEPLYFLLSAALIAIAGVLTVRLYARRNLRV